MTPRLKRYCVDIVATFACLALFLLNYLPTARLLGIDGDDAGLGRMAWDFLRQIQDPLPALDAFIGFSWRGLVFPIAWSAKHGPGEIFLAVPFVALLGHTKAALVWKNACLALISVALTYQVGRLLYRDRWCAFLSALLLCTFPPLIITFLVGGGACGTCVALELCSLFCFLRFAEERRDFWACAAFAALGLGLFSRSEMLAPIFGFAGYGWLYRRSVANLLPAGRKQRLRLFASCLGCLLLFAAALIPALLVGHHRIPSYWIGHLFRRRMDGGSNLAYGANLGARLRQAEQILGGVAGADLFAARRADYLMKGLAALAVGFLGAAAALAYCVVKRGESLQRLALPWIVMSLYVLISAFSPEHLLWEHLVPVLPLFCLAILLPVALRNRRRYGPAVLAAFILLAAARSWACLRFFQRLDSELARTGATRDAQRPCLDLFAWLSRRPEARVAIVSRPNADYNTLLYLSGDRLPMAFVFGSGRGVAGFKPAETAALLGTKGCYFIRNAAAEGGGRRFALVSHEAAGLGYRLRLAGTVPRPDGKVFYEIYRASPGDRARRLRRSARID